MHSQGQDTWTIPAGSGDDVLDAAGACRRIEAGDVVIARTGQARGVYDGGAEPLRFISVASPGDAGHRPLSNAAAER